MLIQAMIEPYNQTIMWETAIEVIFMAKKGMKRPDLREKPGKMPIVPQIQGKAKSGKEKASPIIAGTMGAELKVWHPGALHRAFCLIRT